MLYNCFFEAIKLDNFIQIMSIYIVWQQVGKNLKNEFQILPV